MSGGEVGIFNLLVLVLVLILCKMVLELIGVGSRVAVGKRVRLNEKTPAHLVSPGFLGSPSRPRVWKRFRVCDHHDGAHVDAKRKCVHEQVEGHYLYMTGWWLAEVQQFHASWFSACILKWFSLNCTQV